jgi:hypothetical protein
MTQREKYIAGGVGAAVVLYILNQLVFDPYFEKRHELETKTLAAIRAKSEADDLINRHPRMEEKWKQITNGGLSTDFSLASRKARSDVDEWIRQSGVTMNQLNSDRVTDAKPFQVISFTVDVSGSTKPLFDFLQAIETSPAPIRIVDLTISPAIPGTDELRIKLNLSTLSLKPEIPGSVDSNVSSAIGSTADQSWRQS